MTDTLPSSSHVGRVALRVGSLEETVAFYRDVVGLAVRSRNDETATLGTPTTPLLELSADPDLAARPESAAGLFHTAFRAPTRGALADALKRIRDHWHLDGASDHLVSEALYLSDPEGNGVEIYCDRSRDEWPTTDDGRVEMTTDPLDLADLATRATGDESAPENTDVGHVHLEVTSLAAAREFYADTLGLNVRQQMRGALFLAAGDYHHHVGCNVWNGRSEPARGRGLSWFEIVVPDADALATVRERFRDAGVDVSSWAETAARPSDQGGFAVVDPSGIELRIRSE